MKSQDGTDRFERYLKGWQPYYKIKLYDSNDKQKRRPIVISNQSVDELRSKYRLNEKDVYFRVHKSKHKGHDLVDIELRYPYGVKRLNDQYTEFNDVINWNTFLTEICVGEGHKELRSTLYKNVNQAKVKS